MSDAGKPYETSPTGRPWRAPDFQHVGQRRRLPAAPVLLGADFASIELRLAAAVALGRFERGMFGGDSEDHAILLAAARGRAEREGGPLLVARPPGRPRGKSIAFGPLPPERERDPEPVQPPIEVRCQPCGGRGWTHPSMIVGFHPQRCRRCGGTGKVLVR